jgi:hypothetical protein
MNPNDHLAEAVWQRTLPLIRSTRRRRACRRITGAAAVCCGLAVWLTLQGTKPVDKPVVHIKSATPVLETIAVMRIDDNGTIRLEEVASNELGTIELSLGQTPVLSQEMPYW